MADDAEHRNIVQGINVVLGDAPEAARLLERNGLDVVSEFANQSAKVGIGIINLPYVVQHFLVVEAETGRVAQQGDIRDAVEKSVVALAQRVNQRVTLADRLDRHHQLVATFPFTDELGNDLGGVLEIGGEIDGGGPARLRNAVIG